MANLAVRRVLDRPTGTVSVRNHAAPHAGGLSIRHALLARLEVTLHPGQRWTTWIGTEAAQPVRTATPRSLDELVWLVDHAVGQGLGIRAVGAGHSTSAAARPDDLLVDMGALVGARGVRWLKPDVDAGRHRTVLAGTRVKRLNHALLGGLALPNMGSFDGQSIAGAISTGTHGSSLHTGPMADSVRSVDLVVVERRSGQPRACAYRLEPTDGVTDRESFHSGRAHHGMELLQDDDLFYSSVVAFGAVGLVHAFTLELEPEFWLQEENDALPWSQLRELLEPHLVPGFDVPVPPLATENHFVEFLVNAAEVQPDGGDPTCLLRRRNRVPAVPEPRDWDGPWPPRRVPAPWLQQLSEAVVRPRIDRRNGRVLGVDIGASVRRNFEGVAGRPPFEGGLDRSVSHIVLRRERDDTAVEQAPEPPPEAISNEMAVPVEDTVALVDRVLDLMHRSQDFYAVPFGVRFVGASAHHLAPQHGRPTTMVEVPMVLPLRDRRRERDMPAFRRALETIEDALCYSDEFAGRPHWGQHHSIDRGRLERIGYQRLDTFTSARRRFDAAGTFENRHTRQLGLER